MLDQVPGELQQRTHLVNETLEKNTMILRETSSERGPRNGHQADVKAAITGTHMDIAVETVADLDEQSLIKKLQAATGAHKPNGYEFDTGEPLLNPVPYFDRVDNARSNAPVHKTKPNA